MVAFVFGVGSLCSLYYSLSTFKLPSSVVEGPYVIWLFLLFSLD